MERMENSFAALRALLEERLPLRTAIQTNGETQIEENRVPIGAEARNAMPGRPPLHEVFPDHNHQRPPMQMGEPIELRYERPIRKPMLQAGQRNGFLRQPIPPPPFWAQME
ncbi:hypothetical protein FCV25MIE_24918 [Fagus crenata]